MGQRHQIYLIAQVRTVSGGPKTYRCVAAVHHQWGYARVPLWGTANFKQLARNKTNAEIIRCELDAYAEGLERDPENPCPYISFLARCSFIVGLNGVSGLSTNSSVSELSAGGSTMKKMELNYCNDDGVTIIDISYPGNPRYCHVFTCLCKPGAHNHNGGSGSNSNDPLTGEQYLRNYVSDDKMMSEPSYIRAVQDLDDMPVIRTQRELAEVWPDFFKDNNDATGAVLSNEPAAGGHCSTESPETLLHKTVQKLREREALGAEDTETLRDLLGSSNEHGDEVVDLSGLRLSAQQVTRILSCPSIKNFKSLSFAGIQSFDKPHLVQLLDASQELKWLNIYGTSVSDKDMEDLILSHPGLHRTSLVVLHPVFTSRSQNQTSNVVSFQIVYDGRFQTTSVSLVRANTDDIVRTLETFGELLAGRDSKSCMSKYSDCGPFLQALLTPVVSHNQGQTWGERAIACVPRVGECTGFGQGYTMLLWRHDREGPNQHKGDFQYAFLVPGITDTLMSVSTMFQHMEEAGWPKPSDPEAVPRIVRLWEETLANEVVDGPPMIDDIRGYFRKLNLTRFSSFSFNSLVSESM